MMLCDLHEAEYEEILALWQRSGLNVRPEGRDASDAFAQQMARSGSTQRVIGLRPLPAGGAGQSDQPLLAVAVLTHDGRKGWINRLAVDPGWRGRGLAQALIAEAERWFSDDLGLEIFSALIHTQNQPSRALFARVGYQPVDVVYVSKRLRPDA
jgi:RimJ/RimL family protein N-acetyltransferase